MTIKDFNRLSQDKQIELLTKRLGEMKKDKLKTADFMNKEFNFSWPSQKIRDFGYWFDQTNYCLKRYARDGEMVISEREYEKLKNSKEEKESVCNKEYEKVIAEQKRQIEELKKQSGIEAMMQPYLDCSNKYFYVKLPVSVIDKWNEYVKIQLYGRQHAFEIALIKYINKYDHEKVFDRAKHFNDMSKADVEYKTFTISASEKIIDLWKEYCGKVNVFTTAQFTADALREAMNITV